MLPGFLAKNLARKRQPDTVTCQDHEAGGTHEHKMHTKPEQSIQPTYHARAGNNGTHDHTHELAARTRSTEAGNTGEKG